MMAAPAGGAAAAAPAVEEKTTFDVVLEEIPADKKVRRPSTRMDMCMPAVELRHSLSGGFLLACRLAC